MTLVQVGMTIVYLFILSVTARAALIKGLSYGADDTNKVLHRRSIIVRIG